MTFRFRLIVSFFLVSAIPIILLAYVVRNEMSTRLTRQYEEQIDATVSSLMMELGQVDAEIADRLAALRQAITDDNDFRLAIVQPGNDRNFLLDYADGALRRSGFSVLQIQDATGRIVSSGHFRTEFDRVDDLLMGRLRQVESSSETVPLVAMRTPEGQMYVAARSDSFRIGDQAFTVVAGMDLRLKLFSGVDADPVVDLSISLPDGTVLRAVTGQDELPIVAASGSGTIERSFTLPYIDANRETSTATAVIRRDLSQLRTLRRRIDMWIAVVVALAGLMAVILVSWNASRLSRPLADLANRADGIDLDRLDVDFRSGRDDEIGKLSSVLGKMTRRLRTSTVSLREAERRATVGDLARQINHDVKNGLTPIRNIVRHLKEVSSGTPDEFTETFTERLPALDASISYLEGLSTNYGRLSLPTEKTSCDVGEIIRQIVGDYNSGREPLIRTTLAECPPVLGDPVALRRVIENLVTNAVQSLDGRPGGVTIRLDFSKVEKDRTNVRITVSDMGVGMNEDQKARIFENFYTTKESGTGLGLSIARRLIMDLGGSISVDSKLGEGTTFTVNLPAFTPGT